MEVLDAVLNTGLVPLFDTEDSDIGERIISSCEEGGARVVEFRNRRPQAYLTFVEVARRVAVDHPSVILGVGSVVDAPTAALYIASGADFIVSPVLNAEIARVCNRQKVPYLPGCGTASEVSAAEELGVEICKIFPAAEIGGPSFIKSVLAPCPWSRLMPTAGVHATEENVSAWIEAGAACLGMGSGLVTKEMEHGMALDSLATRVRDVLAWIQAARGVPDRAFRRWSGTRA